LFFCLFTMFDQFKLPDQLPSSKYSINEFGTYPINKFGVFNIKIKMHEYSRHLIIVVLVRIFTLSFYVINIYCEFVCRFIIFVFNEYILYRCTLSIIVVYALLDTPSGPMYKRNFDQQKLMYLVNNAVQIHQLLYTQLSFIYKTKGSIIEMFRNWCKLVCARHKFLH
jgi:hypothetical protein